MPLTRRQFLKVGIGAAAAFTVSCGPRTTTPGMGDFPSNLMHGSGVPLERDLTRVLLAFKEPLTLAQQQGSEFKALFQEAGLIRESSMFQEKASGKPYLRRKVNDSGSRFWSRSSKPGKSLDEQPDTIKILKKALEGELRRFAPVYRFRGTKGDNGLVCPLSHVLLIKPASNVQGESLDKTLRRFQLRYVPEISRYLAGYRYYVLDNPGRQTVYEIRQTLLEKHTALVQGVQLDFTPLYSPVAEAPNDPLYAPNSSYKGQWNMLQIQAGGVPGASGWDIARGDEKVVVAIIDYGCDLEHPDLKDSYYIPPGATSLPGATFDFDKASDKVKILPGGAAEPLESHGTFCAGIVGARFNNKGVAGLAGGCKVLPLRLRTWDTSEVAAAIGYAVQNGARVISMSLGGDAKNRDYMKDKKGVMDDAIMAAFNANAVLCAATMNSDERQIYYPAAHPLVIACGASNWADKRCGESDWGRHAGSNYGDELSVVAPGVAIPTTVNSALGNSTANDYDYSTDGTLPKSFDYVTDYGGTSAATPHVAGLAALLISKYPSLTNVQVRDIIELTADKVPVMGGQPSYDYKDDPAKHPNGAWNEEMGYGRINVFRALKKAESMLADAAPE